MGGPLCFVRPFDAREFAVLLWRFRKGGYRRGNHGKRRCVSAAGTLIETFVTLAVVCGIALVVLYFAKRAGVARAFGGAELVGQLPLEPRRAVYLVRLGDKVLVIGASEAGLTKLGEVSAADLPPGKPAPLRFGDVMARALSRRASPTTASAQAAPSAETQEGDT